jgi:hypothetical protein
MMKARERQKTLLLTVVLLGVLSGLGTADAAVSVIHSGRAITGFRGTNRSMWVGRIYVPAGSRQLVVTTSRGYGDCDLYLRHEDNNRGQWDYSSKSNNTDERIALVRPEQGWWQVGILASGNYTGVTLLAQVGPVDQPRRVVTRVLNRGDEFEPNSKRELAAQIFSGQTQRHLLNPDDDEDWIMFAPRQAGRYVLELTNVTIDLKCELWAQRGRDKEKRIEKFEVARGRDNTMHLDVGPAVGYFKIRVESDDNDDTGSYRVSIAQSRATARPQHSGRRPDVYESDNKRDSAVGIRDNSLQRRTIYPRDDEDWTFFAPTRRGEYLLKISGVTADLKGEVWIKRAGDKERKAGKFEVSRRGRTIPLSAKHGVQYFKIRVEADDNDDTADYRLEVVPAAVSRTTRTVSVPRVYNRSTVTTTYRRPTVTTTYRHPATTVYNRSYPQSRKHKSHSSYPSRGHCSTRTGRHTTRSSSSIRIGNFGVSLGIGGYRIVLD